VRKFVAHISFSSQYFNETFPKVGDRNVNILEKSIIFEHSRTSEKIFGKIGWRDLNLLANSNFRDKTVARWNDLKTGRADLQIERIWDMAFRTGKYARWINNIKGRRASKAAYRAIGDYFNPTNKLAKIFPRDFPEIWTFSFRNWSKVYWKCMTNISPLSFF